MGVGDGPKLPHTDRGQKGSAMARTPATAGHDRLIWRELRARTDVACRLLGGCGHATAGRRSRTRAPARSGPEGPWRGVVEFTGE